MKCLDCSMKSLFWHFSVGGRKPPTQPTSATLRGRFSTFEGGKYSVLFALYLSWRIMVFLNTFSVFLLFNVTQLKWLFSYLASSWVNLNLWILIQVRQTDRRTGSDVERKNWGNSWFTGKDDSFYKSRFKIKLYFMKK